MCCDCTAAVLCYVPVCISRGSPPTARCLVSRRWYHLPDHNEYKHTVRCPVQTSFVIGVSNVASTHISSWVITTFSLLTVLLALISYLTISLKSDSVLRRFNWVSKPQHYHCTPAATRCQSWPVVSKNVRIFRFGSIWESAVRILCIQSGGCSNNPPINMRLNWTQTHA